VGRLTIFAKGNLDVRDTLHSLRLGGATAWNGINEVLRVRRPAVVARVRHETWARSDVLLQGLDRPPEDLAQRGLPLGAHPLDSQFSQALFETDADAIVLSAQPDVNVTLARRRQDGLLFLANDREDWPAADQAWLRETCVPVGLLDPDASMANFARIIERIRQRADVPILIYNLSSVVPGEQVHVHEGLDDIVSTRIRRFNLGLIELSQATGVSIIDVDAIVARAGADRLKYDANHLTGEGCRAVAEAVVRVLDDLGVLTAEAASA
jgi:lysophospholipase L1-like esterase